MALVQNLIITYECIWGIGHHAISGYHTSITIVWFVSNVEFAFKTTAIIISASLPIIHPLFTILLFPPLNTFKHFLRSLIAIESQRLVRFELLVELDGGPVGIHPIPLVLPLLNINDYRWVRLVHIWINL